MKNKILLLAESFNRNSDTGEWGPFAGSAGYTLKGILSQSGIVMDECAIDCVFPFQVKPTLSIEKNLFGKRTESIKGIPALKRGKYIKKEYYVFVEALQVRIRELNPNLIIAVGPASAWATIGTGMIASCRGIPTESLYTKHKVIPINNMLAVLRDWTMRPIVIADCCKALRQSYFPEVIRPERNIWLEPTLKDLEIFYENYIRHSQVLSIDIETAQEQITCIGFAPSTSVALVVPFYSRTAVRKNYWKTLEEELKAWKFVRRMCGLDKAVVGQNFLYDVRFLWEKYGITVPYMANDTMLLQHAQQPEMKKSLGFLASIHTNEASWKFMRTKSTRKKED